MRENIVGDFNPRKYYSRKDVVENYDKMRFETEGGQLINKIQVEMITKLLGTKEINSSVLEIGCGTGRFSENLSMKGYDVTAIDYSKNMIQCAMKKNENQKILNIQYIIGDAFFLPIKGNSFDCIYSIHVLMHFNTWENILKNGCKLLRRDGFFIFDLPNQYSFSFFGKVIRAIFNKLHISNQIVETEPQTFTKNEIINIIKKSGLVIKKQEMAFFIPQTIFQISPTIILPFIKKIDHLFLKTPLKFFATDMYFLVKNNE